MHKTDLLTLAAAVKKKHKDAVTVELDLHWTGDPILKVRYADAVKTVRWSPVAGLWAIDESLFTTADAVDILLKMR